jgi:OOP family OmpA-OmpF porin
VRNESDLCPNTPAGAAVDGSGCPSYTDADSVPDYLDECPATPAGVRVDIAGCPIDTDADGVAEHSDDCPQTPSGIPVDTRGCPEDGFAIVTNINFDFDSDRVREDAKAKLARVIAIMKESPDIDVLIVGYTDDVGPVTYNEALSLRRARSIKAYMASQGIGANRMGVAGRGESAPIVANSTSEGQAVNRRVEFEVVN